MRGGLFDVFPPDRDLAVRVELEGDRSRRCGSSIPTRSARRERLEEVWLPPFAAAEESEEARRAHDRADRAAALGGRAHRVRAGGLADAGRAGSITPPDALLVIVEPAVGRGRDRRLRRAPRRPTAIPTATRSRPRSSCIRPARIRERLSRRAAALRPARPRRRRAAARDPAARRGDRRPRAGARREAAADLARALESGRGSLRRRRGRPAAPRSCGASPSSTDSTSPPSASAGVVVCVAGGDLGRIPPARAAPGRSTPRSEIFGEERPLGRRAPQAAPRRSSRTCGT